MKLVARVSGFGPLIISIDAKGNNLFEANEELFNRRKKSLVEDIGRQVRSIK